MCVYVHACAATPIALVKAMTRHGITAQLNNVEVIHLHTQGDAEYAQPHCKGTCFSTLSVQQYLMTTDSVLHDSL